MLVSYNWLKQFLALDGITPQDIANKLTLHSVEVEEIISLGANLDNVVVGKVTEVKKHENADSLNVCQVDDGTETVQIVCGGSNVTEGMLCALGKVGAKVQWHGEGDLIELKKAKIRGETSFGMICAAEEIGLGAQFPSNDEKGIMDISHLNVAVGTPLKDALGLSDVLIDVENKTMTHRPDLWGHYGMAREVSAIFGTALSAYDTAPITAGTDTIDVSITSEHCHRYMGVAISGITIGPSPQWMQDRITAVGMAPKNNMVDITNYVMLELGQPMHAFDGSQIGDDITVRQAHAEESFTALGGKEYVLTTEDMVIVSGGKVVALAGVKGDEFSGVTDATTSILLEAATFDPTAVRRAATRHGLRTDASARFEKSLDTNLAEVALRRAVELVLELCPNATVTSTVADVTPHPTTAITIDLDMQYLCARVGIDLSVADVTKTLEALGFGVAGKKDILKVTVPTWRATKDVSIQEDLIEEVARMYGYNNIPVALPVANIAPPVTDSLREMEKTLTNILTHECGYTEVYNYSFVAPEYLAKLGISTNDHLELNNPVAKDRPYLRKYLFPNMLQDVEANLHRFDEVALFEIGRVFEKTDADDMMAQQATKFVAMFAAKGVDTPFFEMSTVLNRVADALGVSVRVESVTKLPAPWDGIIHPGRVATIFVDDTAIGSLSELHPLLGEQLGIPYRTASLELHVDTLAAMKRDRTGYEPIPAYPSVERDVSFVVDQTVSYADIVAVLTTDIDHHIRSASLLDVYTGEHVVAGKKSMAYRIEYRSNERTMESKEVDSLHSKVMDMLKERFGAEIR